MTQIQHAMMSETCSCDAPKSPKKIFCEGCFVALEPKLRRDIYSRDSHESAGAFEDALERLAGLGRVVA